MSPVKRVCVFCSSSEKLAEPYYQCADELGKLLGLGGCEVIFGGGGIGLMGRLARSVQANGGRMTGVIPIALNREGMTYENCDELIVTKDMRERKAVMDTRAEAFIALPGGFGTLEELVEHMTLKQLRYHRKPIVIVNTNQFYSPLMEFFDHVIAENFAHPDHRDLYFVAEDPEEAMSHLESYRAPELPTKFE